MKNVLITGGAGFIAHHIIAHMIKNTNWNIITIDRLDISGNLNRLHDILKDFSINEKKRLKIVFHDLKAEINSQIKSEVGNPDIILHLAAASHVDRSIKYPLEFFFRLHVATAMWPFKTLVKLFFILFGIKPEHVVLVISVVPHLY